MYFHLASMTALAALVRNIYLRELQASYVKASSGLHTQLEVARTEEGLGRDANVPFIEDHYNAITEQGTFDHQLLTVAVAGSAAAHALRSDLNLTPNDIDVWCLGTGPLTSLEFRKLCDSLAESLGVVYHFTDDYGDGRLTSRFAWGPTSLNLIYQDVLPSISRSEAMHALLREFDLPQHRAAIEWGGYYYDRTPQDYLWSVEDLFGFDSDAVEFIETKYTRLRKMETFLARTQVNSPLHKLVRGILTRLDSMPEDGRDQLRIRLVLEDYDDVRLLVGERPVRGSASYSFRATYLEELLSERGELVEQVRFNFPDSTEFPTEVDLPF